MFTHYDETPLKKQELQLQYKLRKEYLVLQITKNLSQE